MSAIPKVHPRPSPESPLDVDRIREDFPILKQMVHGRPLVYLDSAATSQKPQAVIDTLVRYYREDNSNVHRGVHTLSERATRAYEEGREKVRAFIGAKQAREIVFVRGTTEAINLVAYSYGAAFVKAGDEILITALEHHSNIVPWQLLCERTGARLKVAPMTDSGELVLEEFDRLLSGRTRLVAVSHVSNALGTILPVKVLIARAHALGVPVLVDGAQAVPHLPIDVVDLDADFYCFSSHKMFGPTGVGVLYGKSPWLEAMPPWQGGGDMIASVSFEKTTYNVPPFKFEAGTPDIAGVIGLGVAVDYMEGIGRKAIAAHEHDLLSYATRRVSEVPGLRVVGTAKEKASVLSFVLPNVHPHDIGTVLDGEGIAVRTGHHCAMPVMTRLDVPATARASFAVYNTREDVDALVAGLHKVLEVFR